jgi:PKD repeat protein
MKKAIITIIMLLLLRIIALGQTVDYPGTTASFIPSCNFETGRTSSIDTWVNHWIGVGTYAGAISWFHTCKCTCSCVTNTTCSSSCPTPNRGCDNATPLGASSAHFVIRASDGAITQTVKVNNTAFHAGATGQTNNSRSIGVEHEATLANPGLWNSVPMLTSSVNMACYFSGLYNIPRVRALPGIREHKEMPGTNTQCAGTIPWSTWMSMLNTSVANNCSNSGCTPPTNDNCNGAISLIPSTNCNYQTYNTNCASQSIAATSPCNGFTNGNADDDVWFKFSANAGQTYTVRLLNGTSFDGVLNLRTGSCNGTSVACDDQTGNTGVLNSVTYTPTSSQTLYVRVYHYGSGSGGGSFQICVVTSSQPGNDITVTNTSVSPSSVNCGNTVDVSVDHFYSGNILDTDLPTFDLEYYLSTDCNLSANDILLGDETSGLGSDDPVNSESATLNIPSGTSDGNYYILFVGDADNELAESNENNNVACEALTVSCSPTGDITVTNTSVSPSAVTCGNSVDVSVDHVYSGNQLDTDLPTFDLDYYLSTDCNLSANDILLGDETSGLGSDDPVNSESATLTIPLGTSAGNFYILFVGDADNELAESNENNNIACESLTVSCSPNGDDIFVANQNLSLSIIEAGTRVVASADHSFSGLTPRDNLPSFYLGFLISNNCDLDPTDIFLDDAVSSLGSDDPVESESFNLTIPGNLAIGTYNMLFVGDYRDDLLEEDEINNIVCQQFQVTMSQADVYIANLNSSNSQVEAGTSIQISCNQIYNGTTEDSHLPNYEVAYFLSNDCQLDESDILLDSDDSDIGSDDPINEESETVNIPIETQAGNYFLLFHADHRNELFENDEENNIDCIQITISNCSVILSPSTASIASNGGNGIFNVTASSGCNWSAAENCNWVTISSGSSGTGNGTVNYVVLENSTTTTRSCTLTIAGQTHIITQSPPVCNNVYTISPPTASFSASAANGLFTVTSGPTCDWSVSENCNWVTISSGSSGTGNGTVNYAVLENTTTTARTCTLTIAGQTHIITQNPPVCNNVYTISPPTASFSASATNGSFTVTTGSTCSWTVSENCDWVTITSANNSVGNGTVTYSVSENTSTSPRTCTITIEGQTHTITQSGIICSYTISPTNNSFAASSGNGSINITTNATSCQWSASTNCNWVTFTSANSGTGNGTVTYSVIANNTTSPRTCTITIDGQTHTITQSGVDCNYTISPANNSFTASSGNGSINVATNATSCQWAASTNCNWVTITSANSGVGNGNVTYSVSANTATSPRTCTITIDGQTHTITQSGVDCNYTISPVNNSFTASSGNGSINVATNATSCQWAASTNCNWVTITSANSGVGNGTVTYSVSANTSTSPRTCTITIDGQTHTITQSGVDCNYTISPANNSFTASSGNGSINVATNATSCQWAASTNCNWVTITSANSGVGNGTVTYSVSANTSTSPRTCTITIDGQTHTITQSGVDCNYTISPANNSFTASSGNGSINVATNATSCQWSASTNCNWVIINSANSGIGNGAITYSVSANTSTNPRTCTITIEGQIHTITQQGEGETAPIANFSASPTIGDLPLIVNFTDESLNNPTSWSWTFDGANPSSSTLQNPQEITYTTPGLYSVRLEITNATGDSDDEYKSLYIEVKDPTVGIEEWINISEITLYPNPTEGVIFMAIESSINDNIKYSVFDAIGRLILTKNEIISNGKNVYKVDLSNTPSGIYELTININGKTRTFKISKIG